MVANHLRLNLKSVSHRQLNLLMMPNRSLVGFSIVMKYLVVEKVVFGKFVRIDGLPLV